MGASTPDGDGGREVGVAEACRLLGLSEDAVRKRLKRGTLPARKVGGVWRIAVRDATPDATGGTAGDGSPDMAPGGTQAAAPTPDATGDAPLVAALRDEVAFLREQLRAKDVIINNFARREQEFAALRATTERVNELEAEIRDRTATTDATTDAAGDEPDTRPPWWRRLLGLGPGAGRG